MEKSGANVICELDSLKMHYHKSNVYWDSKYLSR